MKFRKIIILFAILLTFTLLLTACNTPAMDKPEDLPEDTRYMQLESVKTYGNLVCVTVSAGGYDEISGYTLISDKTYTFALSNDQFSASYWEFDYPGATSTRKIYDTNEFASSISEAVRREAFHPIPVNIFFNTAGEVEMLNHIEIWTLRTPSSDEEEYIEPIELLAQNAHLGNAPDIVLESVEPHKNLGGWKDGNTVEWDFDISYNGNYEVGLLYSRPHGSTQEGLVCIYAEGESSPIALIFSAEGTGEDWSVYEWTMTTSVYLEAGSYRLEIEPGSDDYPLTDTHFINLQMARISRMGQKTSDLVAHKEIPQHILDFTAELNEYFGHLCLNGPANVIAPNEDEYLVNVEFTGTEGYFDVAAIEVNMKAMQIITESLLSYMQDLKGYTISRMDIPLLADDVEIGHFFYDNTEGKCSITINDKTLETPFEVKEP